LAARSKQVEVLVDEAAHAGEADAGTVVGGAEARGSILLLAAGELGVGLALGTPGAPHESGTA